MAEGIFGTAINCMDGRVQEPVNEWLKKHKGVDYVDEITEPGPIKALSEGDPVVSESIRNRVLISAGKHNSKIIAVIGHHDCAGNPLPKEEQVRQILKAIEVVRSWGTGADVIGLYVNDKWDVEIVNE